jgi:molybdenum-dependent oxidoreductase-like protein
VRGIAFGGDTGLAKVMFSADAGSHWQEARLGPDHGKYSFRQWHVDFRPSSAGSQTFMVKAFNAAGASQPDRANWNVSGFMRNVVESITVQSV